MLLFRFRERDRDLGEAVLEVELQWDERESLATGSADQLADLARVEQELARARGCRVVVAPRSICRDGQTLEPHLAIAHVRVRFTQTGFAGAQRLHLCARKHEACLPCLQ